MVIPSDWELVHIGDISEVKTGPFGSALHASDYVNVGTPIVTVEHLGEFGLEGSSAPLVGSRDASRLSSYILRKGDIVFSRVGSIGRFGYVEEQESGWLFSGRLLRLRLRRGNARFLYYQMCSKPFINQIFEVAVGQTMPSLNTVLVANLKVCLPPVNEQAAIAETLCAADAAIVSLEALITKKRAIRDSVLYELIVNQGGLREISFSKDVSLKARIGWQGLTTAEYQVTGDCFLVTGTDLNGGAVDWGTCWQVAQSRYDQDPHIQLRNGDVLVTKDGTIGKVGFVADLPGKATLNSGVFVIRPTSNELLPEYLRYVMFSPLFDRFLNRLTAGSTILHLYQKDFVNFSFRVPVLEQQARTSTILKDLDDELVALSAEKVKLEMIKQGMMQNLLTGKVRLV